MKEVMMIDGALYIVLSEMTVSSLFVGCQDVRCWLVFAHRHQLDLWVDKKIIPTSKTGSISEITKDKLPG